MWPNPLPKKSLMKNSIFLCSVSINNPKRSEYFRQSPPKAIQTNFFFITDISYTSISDITADENDAYPRSPNTNKFYYCDNDQTSIVREYISGKLYYNEKLSGNFYKKFTSHRIRLQN